MPKLRALLLSAALLMLTATAQASVQAAEEAALAWLVKIDNSEYEQAWEAAYEDDVDSRIESQLTWRGL